MFEVEDADCWDRKIEIQLHVSYSPVYDVILFPNKLVFVALIFDALSFLVIFQII